MKITVRITKNYGNTVVYPVCENAQRFAALTGHKTLTPQALRLIRELGYAVEVEQQALAALGA